MKHSCCSPLWFYQFLLLLSRFSHVRLCVTPYMVAHQDPPFLGFSRREHWNGLPFPSPMHESVKWKRSRSVVSDSLRPHGLQPTRLLCSWDFPGKNTGVGCHYINLYFHKQCKRVHFSPHSFQYLIFIEFLMMASMTYVWWYLIVVFIWMPLIISGVEYLFMSFLSICMSLWRDICSGLPPIFFFLDWIFFILTSMRC